MLSYRQQHSRQTLAEALGEYRRANPDLIEAAEPEGIEMLRRHDAAHVVFGCTTDLRGEVLVHAWTVFGTTQSIREAHDSMQVMEHRQLFDQLGLDVALTACKSIPGVARVTMRGLRMRRKWVYDDFDVHMHRPLADIRRDFGIRVVP